MILLIIGIIFLFWVIRSSIQEATPLPKAGESCPKHQWSYETGVMCCKKCNKTPQEVFDA